MTIPDETPRSTSRVSTKLFVSYFCVNLLSIFPKSDCKSLRIIELFSQAVLAKMEIFAKTKIFSKYLDKNGHFFSQNFSGNKISQKFALFTKMKKKKICDNPKDTYNYADLNKYF